MDFVVILIDRGKWLLANKRKRAPREQKKKVETGGKWQETKAAERGAPLSFKSIVDGPPPFQHNNSVFQFFDKNKCRFAFKIKKKNK